MKAAAPGRAGSGLTLLEELSKCMPQALQLCSEEVGEGKEL